LWTWFQGEGQKPERDVPSKVKSSWISVGDDAGEDGEVANLQVHFFEVPTSTSIERQNSFKAPIW
jgi:hypothetical protein